LPISLEVLGAKKLNPLVRKQRLTSPHNQIFHMSNFSNVKELTVWTNKHSAYLVLLILLCSEWEMQ